MKITIKETGETKELSFINPKSGVNHASDLIDHQGAFVDGQFEQEKGSNTYVCSQDTFDWWHKVVTDNQLLEYRIHNLIEEHGMEVVHDILDKASNVELEDHAAEVNQALDEEFGPQ